MRGVYRIKAIKNGVQFKQKNIKKCDYSYTIATWASATDGDAFWCPAFEAEQVAAEYPMLLIG